MIDFLFVFYIFVLIENWVCLFLIEMEILICIWVVVSIDGILDSEFKFIFNLLLDKLFYFYLFELKLILLLVLVIV